MKYTVILLYPDYMATNYGQDIYATHQEASNAELAVLMAQESAANLYEAEPEDFYPLFVVAGHHDDLTP